MQTEHIKALELYAADIDSHKQVGWDSKYAFRRVIVK